MEVSRLFLLSLAALPACGPKVDADPTPEEACAKFFDRYLQCYEELYGYVAPEGYDPAMYCPEYVAELSGDTPACAEAFVEVMTCLSSLECQALTAFGDGECVDAFRRANELCPEFYGYCQIHSVSGGGNGCGLEGSSCLDGNRYGVTCTEADGQLMCECRIDGEAAGTYVTATTCDGEFQVGAVAECGFPPGAP